MKKYVSKESVRARKITDDDGETVITTSGIVHAPKGSYEVHHEDGRVEVQEGDTFESRFTAQSSTGGSTGTRQSDEKPATKKRELPAKSAAKKTAAKKSSGRR